MRKTVFYGLILENVSLKDYNTYKIGGKTRYLVKPYNIDSLKELPIEEQDKIIADTIRYGLDREIIHGDDPRV